MHRHTQLGYENYDLVLLFGARRDNEAIQSNCYFGDA